MEERKQIIFKSFLEFHTWDCTVLSALQICYQYQEEYPCDFSFGSETM